MDMRKIYAGTALPQMMYACSIWSNASAKGKLYTKKILNTLQSMPEPSAGPTRPHQRLRSMLRSSSFRLNNKYGNITPTLSLDCSQV
ncbi:hypothetical protein BU25DRAFT_405375 [Macroventuria anomochaeta]|uniref:Uncharacterized protein n=1 Tax=Macroventuria anomochaeta TaxID=301207 RepID=A0ACB6SGM0_9PLEO|nr:uncharacterized protein BU25DRAFT_405375 [Macroventuria anomochaeta]KAF2633486.1 hypothetical protein BU25DRAFT_405375 [Macroventuria anomochaeta]